MALPFNSVRDLMKTGSNLAAETDKPVRLAVAVELDAPEAVLGELETALVPRRARADVSVAIVAESGGPRVGSDTDVLIAVLGSGGQDMARFLEQSRGFPGLRVVTLALAGATTATPMSVRQPTDDFLVADEAGTLVRDELGKWLADRVEDKRLALAASFDFMRSCVSNEFVKATAWQNALIGGVAIIPGADMPLMTGNQAKMVLQIAAAYGQKLDMDRAKELLAVVGGGLAFRAVARQLLDFLPGFGWALKAGVGYTGTIAMGKAAIAYFEQGADLSGVVHKLQHGAEDMRRRAMESREARGALPAQHAEGAPYKVEASGDDVPVI